MTKTWRTVFTAVVAPVLVAGLLVALAVNGGGGPEAAPPVIHIRNVVQTGPPAGAPAAAEVLRAEKVCRLKALAKVLGEQGAAMLHEELHQDDRVTEATSRQVAGVIRDTPVVGRWRSAGGDLYYLALGVTLDQHGGAVQAPPP
jgi:hypothetical protein